MRIFLILPIFLFLCGCAHKEPPPPPVYKTVCEAVAATVGNQWATYGQVQAALEVGRNKGCFGQPQPQTLNVR